MIEYWNIRKEKRTERVKIWVHIIDFLSPLEFSKFCLTVEARNITLSDMVLSVCSGNIQDNSIMGKSKGK